MMKGVVLSLCLLLFEWEQRSYIQLDMFDDYT
jgi:hypothetical protein